MVWAGSEVGGASEEALGLGRLPGARAPVLWRGLPGSWAALARKGHILNVGMGVHCWRRVVLAGTGAPRRLGRKDLRVP